jgi:hypothetical protein
MRVQRVLMPGSEVESWTLLGDIVPNSRLKTHQDVLNHPSPTPFSTKTPSSQRYRP